MAFDYSLLDDELEDKPTLPIDPNAPAEDPNALLEIINSDPELIAAREEKSRRLAQAGIGQGLSEIGTALASQGRVKPNTSAYEDARKSADSLVDDARKSVTGKTKIVSDFIKGQSAKAKALKSDEKFDKKFNQQNDLIAAIRGEKAASLELAKKKQLDSDVEGLSKRLETSGLSELDSVATNLNSSLKLDDDKADIPGFGATYAVPDLAVSKGGTDARQDFAALKNIILKARSGGSVTPQESERMLAELGEGYAKTDAQLRHGVKNVLGQLRSKAEGIRAGYNSGVVDEYSKRGGKLPFTTTHKKPPLTPEQAAALLAKIRAAKGQ